MNSYFHTPVLLQEVIEHVELPKNGYLVDGTIGGGGHAKEILKRFNTIHIIGLDRDADAICEVEKNLDEFRERVTLMQRNFSEVKSVLEELKIPRVDAVLLDLGISSHDIDTPERGFSFDREGPLDMRMSRNETVNATTLINSESQEALARIIKDFGEEPRAKKIAAHIIRERENKVITKTHELKKIIQSVCGSHDIKPVVRVFQALRIAVNRELEMLQKFLEDVISILNIGGRFLCLSYHSLEDRMIKRFMKEHSLTCICPPHFPVCMCDATPTIKVITKKPIVPSADEMETNRRARSAKLRVCERIA